MYQKTNFLLIWRQCASLFIDFTFEFWELNSYIIIYYYIINLLKLINVISNNNYNCEFIIYK